MRIELEDLFCPGCRSYVHPFLERCPACGRERTSRFAEAELDRPGDRSALLASPAVASAATSVLRRHALTVARGGFVGMGVTSGPEIAVDVDPAEIVSKLAQPLAFRASGLPSDPRTPADVTMGVAHGALEVRSARTKSALTTIDLAHVVSVTPRSGLRHQWAGIAFRGFVALPSPPIETGDLLMTSARHGTFSRIGIGNRGGLFASKARPDYYVDLARWLGIASAVAAEERWADIGPAAYAAEIGLGPSAPRRASEPSAPSEPAPHRTATEALLELERLRAAKLVSEVEYARKRQEILERL